MISSEGESLINKLNDDALIHIFTFYLLEIWQEQVSSHVAGGTYDCVHSYHCWLPSMEVSIKNQIAVNFEMMLQNKCCEGHAEGCENVIEKAEED